MLLQILTLDGLAKSKQDTIHHGHGAQCSYSPSPAGASQGRGVYYMIGKIKA